MFLAVMLQRLGLRYKSNKLLCHFVPMQALKVSAWRRERVSKRTVIFGPTSHIGYKQFSDNVYLLFLLQIF